MRSIQDADRRLRDLLRGHDPADRFPPPPAERVAAMRRRILAETATADRRRDPWWLVAALAVLALALALGPLWWSRAIPAATESDRFEAAPATHEIRATREIQYVTQRGTLVVWILDPKFNLPARD